MLSFCKTYFIIYVIIKLRLELKHILEMEENHKSNLTIENKLN